MSKYYFEEEEAERCYEIETIKDRMRFDDIKERKVFEAVRELNADAFWCKIECDVGEKGHCGRDCKDYKPRNGKNGNCKHNGPVYCPGNEILIKV